ncbi:DUF5673 domain-containing protein [Falsibacillus pallidus]|uniref:DUF5673 domain-containing protein n=1 Tax=Falsibacillus pallidus TaxID=493781 RepID=UPI003D95A7DD
MDTLHVLFVSVVCAIVFLVYLELIVSYHKRNRLGKVTYPERREFDEYSLLMRWKTTDDSIYRIGIIVAYILMIFVVFAWGYNVFVEPFYGLTIAAGLPYLFFFSNVIEIRHGGLMINGHLVNWEEIDRYEWHERKGNASLVLFYKKRKLGFKKFRSGPMPLLLSRKLEEVLKNQPYLNNGA